jgi:hypothetical protein
MKVKSILLLCGVVALPQLAAAAESRTAEGSSKQEPVGTQHVVPGNNKPTGAQHASPTSKASGSGQNTETPQALGMVHAILNYCAQIDPHDASAFQALWKTVLGNSSEQQTEGNSGYQQSYTLISTELGQTSKQAALQACATGAKSVIGENDRRTSGVEPRERE